MSTHERMVELDCAEWIAAARQITPEQAGLLFSLVLAPGSAHEPFEPYPIARQAHHMPRDEFDRLWTPQLQQIFEDVRGRVIREVCHG
jgi:hypothetical protein